MTDRKGPTQYLSEDKEDILMSFIKQSATIGYTHKNQEANSIVEIGSSGPWPETEIKQRLGTRLPLNGGAEHHDFRREPPPLASRERDVRSHGKLLT